MRRVNRGEIRTETSFSFTVFSPVSTNGTRLIRTMSNHSTVSECYPKSSLFNYGWSGVEP